MTDIFKPVRETENAGKDAAKTVREFFRHLGASAGLHPSVAEKVSDIVVGPESESVKDEEKEGE